MEFPPDFDHGQTSPELLKTIDEMAGRRMATGDALPPQSGKESDEVKAIWRDIVRKNDARRRQ